MRLFCETHHTTADITEPPESYDEIADVLAVEIDEDFPADFDELTEEEVLALAAELLTEEEAEELAAEIEAEFFQPVELEQPPLQNDVQSDDVCAVDQEEMEQERQKAEEQEMFRLSRVEIQKRLAEIDEELEMLRIRKEKRHKEQAEYLELIGHYEQERKERQEKERIKRQEDIERKKLERERRKQAMTNPLGFQPQVIEGERPLPPRSVHKTPEELAHEREQRLSQIVPPLDLDAASEEEVREVAADLHARLKNVFGVIFDLNEKMKETESDVSLRDPTEANSITTDATLANPATTDATSTGPTEVY